MLYTESAQIVELSEIGTIKRVGFLSLSFARWSVLAASELMGHECDGFSQVWSRLIIKRNVVFVDRYFGIPGYIVGNRGTSLTLDRQFTRVLDWSIILSNGSCMRISCSSGRHVDL